MSLDHGLTGIALCISPVGTAALTNSAGITSAAVDVTLIRLSDGAELPMPTPYDDFTERAHRNYMELPPEVIQNRELLERVLTKHGFVGLPTEWWHFDDCDWRNYPLLDIPVPASL